MSTSGFDPKLRLKEASLPWIWPRSLRRLVGLSIRSMTPPPGAHGPPDLFFKLLAPPVQASAWLVLEVRIGGVVARAGARTEGTPRDLPTPLYESEIVAHSLNPSWMLSESTRLPAPARTLRSVVVSVRRARAAGPSECLWERQVCFDSLVCASRPLNRTSACVVPAQIHAGHRPHR